MDRQQCSLKKHQSGQAFGLQDAFHFRMQLVPMRKFLMQRRVDYPLLEQGPIMMGGGVIIYFLVVKFYSGHLPV